MRPHFDPATIVFIKIALDDAWNCLGPEAQATVLKTTLAERILKSASQGERASTCGCGAKDPRRVASYQPPV
jgi:hypothetical protein